MLEGVKPKGRWHVRLYGPDGVLKDERLGDNVVVQDGKDYLAQFLNSAATGASTFLMRYVAIGTGTTGEADTDTALESESARVSGSVSYTSATYIIKSTFPAGTGTGAITEYGLFSVTSASCGVMFCRDTESVINKGAGDELQVTTNIEFS